MDGEIRKRYDAQVAAKAMTVAMEQVAVRKLQKEESANFGNPKKEEEGEDNG